ncbi:GNAT family N-acetyltransferase [Olivibacter sp. SDN3]|uniref:GNAT family N-acetyltransferase n=1 Tax=Olivibacter sp. SDN3 TaxID=2764720 RepID=UPI0016519FE1|nr:GNAT family N-acetyltransferase [Olivibacter sp. SDN3]QNL50492.1 GNAT family N-acetyltransferase [Olivibacter sp. SDN3]
MKIRQATIDDLASLSAVFADYRNSSGQDYDLDDGKAFLEQRLTKKDSVIFIAIIDGEIVGFTLLFPFFTPAGIREMWLLNDIYIADEYRHQGVAQSLLSEAIFFSKKTKKCKVYLATKIDNVNSQTLFEKFGFKKTDYINYEFITG